MKNGWKLVWKNQMKMLNFSKLVVIVLQVHQEHFTINHSISNLKFYASIIKSCANSFSKLLTKATVLEEGSHISVWPYFTITVFNPNPWKLVARNFKDVRWWKFRHFFSQIICWMFWITQFLFVNRQAFYIFCKSSVNGLRHYNLVWWLALSK